MATKDSNPEIKAHQEVYAALKELDVETRKRVLSSALALLGMPDRSDPMTQIPRAVLEQERTVTSGLPGVSRPMSLIELMQEKAPTTNAERIALFAYYREKNEGFQRFERADLQPYFAKAKLAPAANYDRDFVEAVKKGWIHEDGADSYLTSKGVEAVESEFPREPKRISKAGKKSGKTTKGRKTSSRKSK